jgi:glycosyltransferase involved in cell wall biosynthesis
VEYSDPWAVGFDERRLRLLRGSPRIAYYYTRPDTSTFRYRAFNMVEALTYAEPAASASWLTADDGARAVELIEQVDVLVVCRALYSPHVAAVIARAKALGKRVLFDVDDLIFDDRYAHLIMETLDQVVDETALQSWFGWISRCGATLRLCDGVITTNEFLAERIRQFADLPTWVIPNFLNRAQLELSAGLREARGEWSLSRDGSKALGYFSGTPTHNRDFALVEPAIEQLFLDDPSVSLRVVGFAPRSERLARFADRIETIPLQDFLNLQIAISGVEINLVPLQDNVFTNCKSELKYFEAAVVGTITVASPTYTLRGSISHGQNGFLARAQDWYEELSKVTSGLACSPLVAEAAAADAIRRYSPEAQAAAIRDALAL